MRTNYVELKYSLFFFHWEKIDGSSTLLMERGSWWQLPREQHQCFLRLLKLFVLYQKHRSWDKHVTATSKKNEENTMKETYISEISYTNISIRVIIKRKIIITKPNISWYPYNFYVKVFFTITRPFLTRWSCRIS